MADLDQNFRFDELVKILTQMGYAQSQPKSGGSHCTFRKPGKCPITIPKTHPSPELRGCVTCADTVQEGFELIEDAKRHWFEACIEDGIAIPEPSVIDDYSGQFKLRMPKSLHKTLADKSKQEGISMNQYCLYLLSKAK